MLLYQQALRKEMVALPYEWRTWFLAASEEYDRRCGIGAGERLLSKIAAQSRVIKSQNGMMRMLTEWWRVADKEYVRCVLH